MVTNEFESLSLLFTIIKLLKLNWQFSLWTQNNNNSDIQEPVQSIWGKSSQLEIPIQKVQNIGQWYNLIGMFKPVCAQVEAANADFSPKP